jgi:hypothetical protein
MPEEKNETGFNSQGLPIPSDQPRTVPTDLDQMTSNQRGQHNLGVYGAINPEPQWNDREGTRVPDQDDAQSLANMEAPYRDTAREINRAGLDSESSSKLIDKLKQQAETEVSKEEERLKKEAIRNANLFSSKLEQIINLPNAYENNIVDVDFSKLTTGQGQKLLEIMGVDFSKKTYSDTIGHDIAPTRIPGIILAIYNTGYFIFERNYNEYRRITNPQPE